MTTPINFNHLHSFWMVARQGGLLPAARALHVSHPTLSAQIHELQDRLGVALFRRRGRRMVLTPAGETACQFADEIFATGKELVAALASGETRHTRHFHVGATDSVPKLVVRELLLPLVQRTEPLGLTVREENIDRMLADLSVHALDAVIIDGPLPDGAGVRADSHLLGASAVELMGAPGLVRRWRRRFPLDLAGAPLLLPSEGTPLRVAVRDWLAGLPAQPRIVASMDDSALLKSFAAAEAGFVFIPQALQSAVAKELGLVSLGVVDGVRVSYFLVTRPGADRDAAVGDLIAHARSQLFATAPFGAPRRPAQKKSAARKRG